MEDSIESTPAANASLLSKLGGELDRLVVLFNVGLHAVNKVRIEQAFADLVQWLSRVIEINPDLSRRPYLAYDEELKAFMLDVLKSE